MRRLVRAPVPVEVLLSDAGGRRRASVEGVDDEIAVGVLVRRKIRGDENRVADSGQREPGGGKRDRGAVGLP
jgi:hypothetical protein